MIGISDGTNSDDVMIIKSAKREIYKCTSVRTVPEEYECVCVRVCTRVYAWLCRCVRVCVPVYACTSDPYPWVGQADAYGRL